MDFDAELLSNIFFGLEMGLCMLGMFMCGRLYEKPKGEGRKITKPMGFVFVLVCVFAVLMCIFGEITNQQEAAEQAAMEQHEALSIAEEDPKGYIAGISATTDEENGSSNISADDKYVIKAAISDDHADSIQGMAETASAIEAMPGVTSITFVNKDMAQSEEGLTFPYLDGEENTSNPAYLYIVCESQDAMDLLVAQIEENGSYVEACPIPSNAPACLIVSSK